MKLLSQILVACLACASALNAFAWGDEGHRAIGAMVDTLIVGTDAAKHVHELLGDETLSTASVWADQVKGRTDQTPEMLQFKAANPNHSTFHYTDIPFEEPKYRDDSIGAKSVDVVHAIPACILILQGQPDAQTVFTNVSQRVALRLLVHYIEDLHQPLHAGTGYLDKTKFVDPNGYSGHFEDDQGANRLVFGGTNKLHFYWDVTVVKLDMARAHAQTPKEYAADLLARPVPDWKTSSPLLQCDRDWANESIALSAKVHDVTVMDEDDSELDYRTHKPRPVWHIMELTPAYIDWSCQTAESQMTKAGYRIAATLETIWP
ncbi:MAG TPA: S1/P1 nuclease [Verrucomicrobiae bacterium]|jgi:hypothetical protein|nr:S1/P1 nuclease [Verrucomicrobiae bacterium]